MDDRGQIDREEAEARAKGRFMAINAARIAGVVMVLAAIAVFNGALPLPEWAGYAFVIAGMFATFVAPTLLSRKWSTNEKR